MPHTVHYLFDGSYEGYLTGLFESYERKEWGAVPVTDRPEHQSTLFGLHRSITTDLEKARRVAGGLSRKAGKKAGDFYRVFLSEDPQAWRTGYRLMQKIVDHGPDILHNFGDPDTLYFAQTLKMVGRERHQMKAFVRFSKSTDGLFFAQIEPDFNVLPLIADFFKNRYRDQRWLIYDQKRNYGLLYDLNHVHEVHLSAEGAAAIPGDRTAFTIALDEREQLFKTLWKQYFNSTNIAARRNIRLHIQHVPKRYWKYLVEK